MKRVAIHTLGCKSNQFDSHLLSEQLSQHDFLQVSPDAPADLYILNTCTVTHRADAEARKIVRRMKRQSPDSTVVVTGCLAQVNPEFVASLSGVDYVIGNDHKSQILDLIKTEPKQHVGNMLKSSPDLLSIDWNSPREGKDFTRFFLKVQDGCDAFCAFCIIPYARGKSRSLASEEVVKQIRQLCEIGYKEVVLTGVQLGGYGKDIGQQENLAHLVARIAGETPLPRLRISSIEPEDIDEPLLKQLSQSRIFCPHFHLPLQSGDDSILARMKRRYDLRYFAELHYKILEFFPDVFIGMDIMVGFPGETDEKFENTRRYLDRTKWAKLHVFPYSPRGTTPATYFVEKIAPSTIQQRVQVLLELSQQREKTFYQNSVGTTHAVLIEGMRTDKGRLKGHSRNYLPVELMGADSSLTQEIMTKIVDYDIGRNILIGDPSLRSG